MRFRRSKPQTSNEPNNMSNSSGFLPASDCSSAHVVKSNTGVQNKTDKKKKKNLKTASQRTGVELRGRSAPAPRTKPIAIHLHAALSLDVPKFPKEKIDPIVVKEGDPVVLECNPPKGIPPLQIYWMTLGLQHIEQDERVSMGLNGNLYFSNALQKDSRRDYCCYAAFPRIRTIVQKTAMSVVVQSTNAILERKPSLLVPSGVRTEIRLVKGEEMQLECIAEGFPTPKIEWTKMGKGLPERVSVQNHGKLLTVLRVQEEDNGKYMCRARNAHGEAEHYFHVTVEEPPKWISMPESTIATVGTEVRINCVAAGFPQPSTVWRVNGQSLNGTLEKQAPLRALSSTLNCLCPCDSAVYQCEASNRHGTILANANILVMNLPPMILTEDSQEYAAVVGSSVIMHCKVFSSPASTIMWTKDDTEKSVEGERFSVHDNGSLEIRSVQKEDMGQYTCFTTNIEGKSAITAILDIKGRGNIASILTCQAEYDRSLRGSFGILWEKDGAELVLNLTESTGYDVEYAAVPPTLQPSHHSAIVKQSKSCFPFSRAEFIVEYEESQWEPGRWKKLSQVPGTRTSALLKLHGHVDYRFRVSAVNGVGRGEPSEPTGRYKTPPSGSHPHPSFIFSEPKMYAPLPPIEHNGPGLEYKVSYRRMGTDEDWKEQVVKRHSFIVKNTPTFVPYEVKIQARNHQGWGPEPKVVIGYSGEDFPSGAPDDVAVEVMNNTLVKVTWTRVHKDKVHGHLGGYRVNWWRLRSLLQSKKGHGEKHSLTFSGDRTHVLVPGLRPFSEYSLTVMAFNGRGNGPGSHPVTFKTPEGAPEQIPILRATNAQRNSITLVWAPPLEANGILTGYLLQFQLINDTNDVGSLQSVNITSPDTNKWVLQDLELLSRYKFYLRACSRVGCGPPISEESATVPEASKGNWKISEAVNTSKTFHIIHGLEPGTVYTVRLVTKNGLDNSSIFEDVIKTRGTGLASMHGGIATQSWFIGLMCAVALLTLIVLIACFINRNKGGKYSVKEKEDLHPDVESQGMNDDTFCEYSDNDEKPLKGSLRSLGGDMKAADSGDSLVDYGDEDGQFNEDGSFIGEYAGRKERCSAEVKGTVPITA
uniref:Neural cell adhesion molecule L1-like protein n=1 Tax=Scleropages formosus TaxID=113540 RepID=A0A8C9U7W5_SCLFO